MLNVDCIDASFVPHGPGQAHGEVRGPGADIGDDRPAPHAYEPHRQIGIFLELALAPIEPWRSLDPHRERIDAPADWTNAGLLCGGRSTRKCDQDDNRRDEVMKAPVGTSDAASWPFEDTVVVAMTSSYREGKTTSQ